MRPSSIFPETASIAGPENCQPLPLSNAKRVSKDLNDLNGLNFLKSDRAQAGPNGARILRPRSEFQKVVT
jgi:hypothetical protein